MVCCQGEIDFFFDMPMDQKSISGKGEFCVRAYFRQFVDGDDCVSNLYNQVLPYFVDQTAGSYEAAALERDGVSETASLGTVYFLNYYICT